MARTQDEIRNEIDSAISADSTLGTQLTSPSKVAIWRLFRDLVVLAIYDLEKLWDLFKAEVVELSARSEYGTHSWYAQKAKEFQYGDSLTIVNGLPGYPTIDLEKQIVKHSAVNDGTSGGLVVKIAKETSGSLAPLTNAEKAAFSYYFNKIKFAGIYSSIISQAGDLVKATISLYHDGQRDIAELESELNDTVQDYLNNIEFDGWLVLIKLQDKLQAVEGVTDVVFNMFQCKASGDIYLDVNRRVNAASGYFKIDSPGITWNFIAE